MKNLYSIVGVDENATAEEIKKSYKKLAKKLHPDKNKSEDAEEKFKELSKAYEVLKNKESRQDYDFQRKYCQKGDESKRFQTKTTYDPRSRTRTFSLVPVLDISTGTTKAVSLMEGCRTK
uniref:DnaJ homolog subfamily B member 9 n=1 Tax=Octopus bimaculoides TaxID=37653 RepID=A0A0L8H8N2_OCTBM